MVAPYPGLQLRTDYRGQPRWVTGHGFETKWEQTHIWHVHQYLIVSNECCWTAGAQPAHFSQSVLCWPIACTCVQFAAVHDHGHASKQQEDHRTELCARAPGAGRWVWGVGAGWWRQTRGGAPTSGRACWTWVVAHLFTRFASRDTVVYCS